MVNIDYLMKVKPSYSLTPIILDGINMGILEREGTEIHCEIFDKYKDTWLLHRKALTEFMMPLLAEDIITTNNEVSDLKGIKRTKLLGFEETWRNDLVVFFMLKKLPFERNRNAAQ